MDRSSSSPFTTPAPTAARMLPTRGPPPSTGQASATSEVADRAEISLLLIEDHDRIAQSLNDNVVRRLFAAGLDLHTALGLIGDHPGAGKIHKAIAELDLAIRDIRDAIFAPGTPTAEPPRSRPPKTISASPGSAPSQARQIQRVGVPGHSESRGH